MMDLSSKLNYQFCARSSLHRALQTRRVMLVFMCIILLFLLVTCGCSQGPINENTNQQKTIACTIPPQEEFIRAIAGDEPVTVLVMVPQGASPHTFEPTPSQIARLESADLYLALGSGIEFEERWISRIKTQYPDLKIVNTSRNIIFSPSAGDHYDGDIPVDHDFLPHEGIDEHSDPHVWLSLHNAELLVYETAHAMMMEWPALNDTFSNNRDVYTRNLTDLDIDIRESLMALPSRTILVYHPAFGYFSRDYNLTQLAVEENGREPSAQKLAHVVTAAKREKITLVFAEPESSTREAETLAREINGTMVLISPLAGNYLENMQNIADTIQGS